MVLRIIKMADKKAELIRQHHKTAESFRPVVIPTSIQTSRSHEQGPSTGTVHKESTLSKMLSQTVVSSSHPVFVPAFTMTNTPKTKGRSKAKDSSEKKPRAKRPKAESKSRIQKVPAAKELWQSGSMTTITKPGAFITDTVPAGSIGLPVRVVTSTQGHISGSGTQITHGHLLEALSIPENLPSTIHISTPVSAGSVTVSPVRSQVILPPKKSISPSRAAAFVDSLSTMHREAVSLSAIETVPAPNRTIVSSSAWPPHDRSSPRSEHIVSIQHGQGQILRPTLSIPVREADRSSMSGIQRIVRIVAPGIGEAEQEAVSQLHKIIAASAGAQKDNLYQHQSTQCLKVSSSPASVRVIRTPSPAQVYLDPHSVASQAQERNKDMDGSQPMNLSVPHGALGRDVLMSHMQKSPSPPQRQTVVSLSPPQRQTVVSLSPPQRQTVVSLSTQVHPEKQAHMQGRKTLAVSNVSEIARSPPRRLQQDEALSSLPFQAYEGQHKSPLIVSQFGGDSRSSPQPNILMQHLVTPYFLQRTMEEAKISGIFPPPPGRVAEDQVIYTDKPASGPELKLEHSVKSPLHEPVSPLLPKQGKGEKKQPFSHRQTPPSQRQTPPSSVFEQRSPGQVIHHYSTPSAVPLSEVVRFTVSASQHQRQNQLGSDSGVQYISKPIPSTIPSSTMIVHSTTSPQIIGLSTASKKVPVSPSHTTVKWSPSSQGRILEAALRKHTSPPSPHHTASPSHHTVASSSHFTVASSSHFTLPISSHHTSTVPSYQVVSPTVLAKPATLSTVVEPSQMRYSPPPRPGIPLIEPVTVPPGIGPIKQPVVNLARLPVINVKQEILHHHTSPSHSSRASEMRPAISCITERSMSPQLSESQPIPQNVNPFTFPKVFKSSPSRRPPSPITSIFHKETTNFSSFSVKSQLKSSEEGDFSRKASESSDDMPRLVPEISLTRENEEVVKVDRGWESMSNPFNMRLQNLANFPTTGYKSTYRTHSVPVHRARIGCITSAAKSLDLLRQNLQKSINKDIQQVLQKYLDKFFKQGIENIKLNNGQNAVSEEHIQTVCRQMLEESKKTYSTETRRSLTPTRDFTDNGSENDSLSGRKASYKKRPPSDSDSEKSHSTPPRKLKKKGRPPLHTSGRSTPSKILKSNEPIRREGPKWDPERLAIDTLFVMGARANKALGFGATRGRLYIKHPEIFKYSGDQDDKQWLYENHHMPATGGKAYMLVLNDIKELAQTEEYRESTGLLLHELFGFPVPEWMSEKIKIQMTTMRTDMIWSKPYRSRSVTPTEITIKQEDYADIKSEEASVLPFSTFSSPKTSPTIIIKTELQVSPGDTDMEFLTGTDQDDGNDGMSPFNMTGGFDDTGSPTPSDLDNLEEDNTLTPPFGLAK